MSSASFGNPPVRSPMVPSMPVHPATLAYPQPVGPVQPPPLTSPQSMQYPPPPPPPQSASIGAVTDWGDAFTEAFLSDDPSALSALTRRIGTNLDVVLPEVPVAGHPVGPDGRGPLSQAVLLTTIHKFTEFLPRARPHLFLTERALQLTDVHLGYCFPCAGVCEPGRLWLGYRCHWQGCSTARHQRARFLSSHPSHPRPDPRPLLVTKCRTQPSSHTPTELSPKSSPPSRGLRSCSSSPPGDRRATARSSADGRSSSTVCVRSRVSLLGRLASVSPVLSTPPSLSLFLLSL